MNLVLTKILTFVPGITAVFAAYALGSQPAVAVDLSGTSACLGAPALAAPSGNVIHVSNEAALQKAISNLTDGTTVVLANGTYNLSRSLVIRKNNVTIRGATDSCDAVHLVGRGMENADYGNVPHGFFADVAGLTIANLAVSDVYFHPIKFNGRASSPHIYNVKLVDAGEQFIKASPRKFAQGVDNGIVEYTIMEYTQGPPKTDHGGGTGYTNGVDVHAGHDWIIRNNLFKNFHTPDSADNLWAPAILMWNGATGTISENNVFINVDRAVAYGLKDRSTGTDHEGGVIRNNMVYYSPNINSTVRKNGSDATIIVWDSPNTKVLHNTILTNGNLHHSIEFRFNTSNAVASNNLADKSINTRNGASYSGANNVFNAAPHMFADPSIGDLHLVSSAKNAIDQADLLSDSATDIDGDNRPATHVDAGADEFIAPGNP